MGNTLTIKYFIEKLFEDFSIRSKMINDFSVGSQYDLNASRNLYPLLHVTIDNSSYGQSLTGILQSNQSFKIYVLDRLDRTIKNSETEILSNTKYILDQLVTFLDQHSYLNDLGLIISNVGQATPVGESFADADVVGWELQLSLGQALRYNPCNSPVSPLDGYTISFCNDVTEYRLIGATGATGPQGATGATGPQGATGPAIDLKWYVEPSTPPTILPKLGPGVIHSIAIGDGAEANDTLMFVIGYRAGQFSGGVQGSNFIGVNTGYQSSNCSYSNFIGSESGFLTNNAHESNFIGLGSGRLSNGSRNSNFIGGQAGAFSNTTTYANFIGFNVGRNFSTGSHNTFIGTNISLPNNTSRSLNIGGVLFGKNLYGTITGNPRTTPVTDGQIGIGVAPSEITNTLHVRATIDPLRIEGLQVTTNTDLLIIDPNGVVSKRTIDSIIPSLQGVTNNGSTTSNNIIIENSLFKAVLGGPNPQNEYASLDVVSKDYFNQYGGDVRLTLNPEELFYLSRNNSGWFGIGYDTIYFVNTNNKNNNLEFGNVTDNRTYNFPDASGTIALQEWVTAQNYLGATPSLNEVLNAGNTSNNNLLIENDGLKIDFGNTYNGDYYGLIELRSKDKNNSFGGDINMIMNPEEGLYFRRNGIAWITYTASGMQLYNSITGDIVELNQSEVRFTNITSGSSINEAIIRATDVTGSKTFYLPDDNYPTKLILATRNWTEEQLSAISTNKIYQTYTSPDEETYVKVEDRTIYLGSNLNGDYLYVNADGLQSNIYSTFNNGLTSRKLVVGDAITPNQFTIWGGADSTKENILISNLFVSSYNTGNQNTILGVRNFIRNSGSENTSIGAYALYSQDLTGTTSTSYNTAIGAYSLGRIKNNDSNTAIGHSSAYYTNGTQNVAVGVNALFGSVDRYTGSYNTAIGSSALAAINSANNNTAIGYRSLFVLSVGDNNIGIGIDAGRYRIGTTTSLSTSNNSIFIGGVTKGTQSGTNEIVIGYGAEGNGSNTITIGNTSILNTYLRGTINASSYKVTGGTSSQFLKADGSLDSNTYLTNATLPTNLVIGSGITNSIAFWNSTTGITASSTFGITGSSVYIGISESQFTFGANRSSFTTVWDGLSGSGLPVYRAVGYSNVNGDNPSFSGFRALGTINTPLVPTQDINLTTFAGLGWNGTGWTTGGQLTFRASETFSATAGGTWLILNLNRNGRIDNDRQWIFEPEVLRPNTDNVVILGTSTRQFNTIFTNNISFTNGVTVRQHTNTTNATLTTIGGDDLSTSLNVRLRNASNNNVALISNTGRFAFGTTVLPDAALQGQVVGQVQFGDSGLVGFEATLRLRNGSTDNFISMVRSVVRGWSIGINSSGVFQIVDRDAIASRLNIDTTGRIGLLGSTPTHTLTLPSNTSGVVLYNTADQTTNFERLRLINTVNTFTLVSEAGNTGIIRSIQIGTEATAGTGLGRFLRINSSSVFNTDNSVFYFTNNNTSLAGSNVMVAGGFNGSSIRQIALTVAPTVSQTNASAINTGILVSPFYTSNSSTNNILIDLGTNTVANAGGTHSSVFQVLSNGKFIIPVGTNQPIGTATLVNGIVTISNTQVTANSTIILTNINPNSSTQLGTLTPGTITPGVSFTVNSLRHNSPSNIETSDNSSFRFWILN